jgi:hypothetical protein
MPTKLLTMTTDSLTEHCREIFIHDKTLNLIAAIIFLGLKKKKWNLKIVLF